MLVITLIDVDASTYYQLPEALYLSVGYYIEGVSFYSTMLQEMTNHATVLSMYGYVPLRKMRSLLR